MSLPSIDFEHLNFATIVLRIGLAILMSGLIGYERGLKNQPAGMRTYILVCVTATMVMMTNQYVATFYEGVDPTRMGAQVVSGIGFLGAGMILITNQDKVKGLTTAAGLWSSACLGLAIGIGFYEGAVIVTLILVFVLAYLHKIKKKIKIESRSLSAFLQVQDYNVFNECIHFFNEKSISIKAIEPLKFNQNALAYNVRLELPKNLSNVELLDEFKFFEKANLVEIDSDYH